MKTWISLQRFCDFCLRFCRSHFDYNICIDIKKYTCVWYILILPLPPPTCTHLILLKFYIWYILILPLHPPTCTHLIYWSFILKSWRQHMNVYENLEISHQPFTRSFVLSKVVNVVYGKPNPIFQLNTFIFVRFVIYIWSTLIFSYVFI